MITEEKSLSERLRDQVERIGRARPISREALRKEIGINAVTLTRFLEKSSATRYESLLKISKWAEDKEKELGIK